MRKKLSADSRRSLLCCAAVLGLLAAAIIFIPSGFYSSAGNKAAAKPSNGKTLSHEVGLDNYDIRTDRTARETMTSFRQSAGKTASAVADLRDSFVSGEKTLQTKIPNLKVEYSQDLQQPEVITPSVELGKSSLSAASSRKRPDILRNFIQNNENLLGVSDSQAATLETAADYTDPNGQMSFAELDQKINGIPVFNGTVKAGFDKTGKIVRVINNLAPGLENADLSEDFGDAANAMQFAAANINHALKTTDLAVNQAASDDLKTVFGAGDFPNTAEKMYFPTEPGVARTAWRVLIWQPNNAYYVIVDAETGAMLWRKNITEDQTQAATFNIYYNANNMVKAAHNPAPLYPSPTNPANGTQGTLIARTDVTLIGNEAPNTFNNLGWLTDGANTTDGNNVQAGLDRDGTDGVDAAGIATGTNRVFSYAYNPAPGNPGPGDEPTATTAYQQGIVTNLFYLNNRYHDELYKLGFTEAARNFQTNNFGRGGTGNDRVSAEAQDSSGTNNANFATPADGGRGKMQMYIFPNPAPDRDGDLDAEVVIHEHTHGLSNRLIGNATGLSALMSRGMGEGWSDFYGGALLSEPTDNVNGIYPTGGYITYQFSGGYTSNYYYGIRRFPYAVLTATGGPNNRPHNPLTFADIDSLQFNVSDGAFARNPVIGGGAVDEVHNAGEVWCAILWEARGKLINRLGGAAGNQKMLQFTTDGMKLTALNPTFIQARDAIITAAQNGGTAADVADLWSGFAARGLGFSAKVLNPGAAANSIRVTESFDLPNLQQTPTITVSDATGNNNGYAEPGETVNLTVPLFNNTGTSATGATLQINGGTAANYGTIVNNATGSQSIAFTVPANTPCGSALNLTLNVNSSLGALTLTRTIIIGVPVTTLTQNFDGVTAPALPTGWTTTQSGAGVLFTTVNSSSDTAPNSAFSPDITTTGGDANLVSPQIPITAPAATVSFRHSFNTEPTWDGGVLEISIGGGAFTDILTAGGRFIQGEYTAALGVSTGSPLGERLAWTGNSNGYITTVAQLPAAAAGQNVQLRWRLGADDNTGATGWNIDTIRVNGSYSCGAVAPQPHVKSLADFDGDGKTDISVFRPSNGSWYKNNSTTGFSVVNWGISGDKVVSGDYDGDGKADAAVYRPSNGTWYVLNSSDAKVQYIKFGVTDDKPVPADYDGDGKTDAAVYRPSNGTWYVLNSSDAKVQYIKFGVTDDKPVPADYDGDGKADAAVYRPSNGTWYILGTTRGFFAAVFGLVDDIPVAADYDGDDKDDIAVYRPSNGTWYVLQSSNSQFNSTAFGASTDIPVPGDYDGDGKDDRAVYRSGTWYMLNSTTGFKVFNFGYADDTTIIGKYQ